MVQWYRLVLKSVSFDEKNFKLYHYLQEPSRSDESLGYC